MYHGNSGTNDSNLISCHWLATCKTSISMWEFKTSNENQPNTQSMAYDNQGIICSIKPSRNCHIKRQTSC